MRGIPCGLFVVGLCPPSWLTLLETGLPHYVKMLSGSMQIALQLILLPGRFDRCQIIRTLYGSIVYFTFPAFELIAFVNPLVPVVILAKNDRVLGIGKAAVRHDMSQQHTLERLPIRTRNFVGTPEIVGVIMFLLICRRCSRIRDGSLVLFNMACTG